MFVRKKPKDHGERAGRRPPEGRDLAGKSVVVVEDVTTTGGSALKAVEAVREAGAKIVLVLTMVDREEGAAETFKQAGLTVPHAVHSEGISGAGVASLPPPEKGEG